MSVTVFPKIGSFCYVKNLQSRKVPGRESRGFRKVSRKVLFICDLFGSGIGSMWNLRSDSCPACARGRGGRDGGNERERERERERGERREGGRLSCVRRTAERWRAAVVGARGGRSQRGVVVLGGRTTSDGAPCGGAEALHRVGSMIAGSVRGRGRPSGRRTTRGDA